MPESSVKIKVIGRAGAGPDGGHGGISWFDGKRWQRAEAGDTVEVSSSIAKGLIESGLVEGQAKSGRRKKKVSDPPETLLSDPDPVDDEE